MKKDEIIDTTGGFGNFGLFEPADEMKTRYKAFAGWRTIMERWKLGEWHLAFLPDRNCAYGTNSDLTRIEKYVKKVVKRLEKWAGSVGPMSENKLEFGEYFGTDRLEGVASPRGSDGYLYIQIGLRR